MKTIIRLALLLASASAHSGEFEQEVLRCSVIGDASARLGCYDALAKMPEAATDAGGVAKALAAPAASANPNAAAPEPAIAAPISEMVQHWELDHAARRGIFAFRPHRDNYLLLANYSRAPNDAPFERFRPAKDKSKHVELNYQLSFKMKLIEQVLDTPVDFWFAYTQQSYWQAYNRAASSPFRETNYQPELMVVLPVHGHIAGWNLRFVNLGLVHQSNGQTSTLSRSWNRAYAELGADHGNIALTARLWKRLDNARSENDNPDITSFMGSGDVRASLRNGGHEYSVMARRNFETRHGALQAGWTFPLSRNLKGYLQLFSGYGQSLIDYNFAQKSMGAGFLVDF